jgi:hypothetical protein
MYCRPRELLFRLFARGRDYEPETCVPVCASSALDGSLPFDAWQAIDRTKRVLSESDRNTIHYAIELLSGFASLTKVLRC